MEAPKKKCKTVAWAELRSWVLNPAYKMSCCKCEKKACFIDVEDGLKHGWVPDHCPDHLPECLGGEKPIDYIPDIKDAFRWETMPYGCTVCGATAIYKNTDDAENHGWWEDNWYWCPDHREEGERYTSSVKLYCIHCRAHEVFEDLEEAYEHGWWKNGSLTYCSEHAGEAIRKHEQATSVQLECCICGTLQHHKNYDEAYECGWYKVAGLHTKFFCSAHTKEEAYLHIRCGWLSTSKT